MIRLKTRWSKMPLTVKVSVAYTVCSILQRGISFITLPIFTRLLTTAEFGQVTIYQSWHAILTIFLTLNLAYGSFSTAMVKYEEDKEGYISSVEGICIALSALFLIIYLPFHDLWNKLFELPTYIMCIMVAETLASTSLLLWNGKKRFEFDYKSVVAITLIVSMISPLVQLLLVFTQEEKGCARIVGSAIVNIVIGGAFFIYNLFKGKKIFSKQYWKYAISFNVPLLAYYLSQIVFNQSDRIMISHMVSEDKAGIYGVAYTLAMVFTFVLNAINNAYVPWFYSRIKESCMRDNKAVSLAISGLIAVLLLGIIWFAPEIIRLMAGEKYEEAIYVVPPVAISVLLLFYAQLFINVEFYYEEKHKLVSASIGAAAVNIALNWVFIQRFGFIAAGYTTLASYMMFVICNYFAMKKTLHARDVADDGFHYAGLIGLLAIFSAVSYIGVALYNLLVPRIIVCLTVLFALFIKRQEMISLYKRIKG